MTRKMFARGVVFEDARSPGLEHLFGYGGDGYAEACAARDDGCRYFDPRTQAFTRARNDSRRPPKRDYLRPDYLL